MIGIVVITHGPLCEGLIESVHMLLGRPKQLVGVPLLEGEGIEELKAKVMEAIKKVNDGSGVLILGDLFGGSTLNVSSLIAVERDDIYIVSGINVPMLLTVLLEREDYDSPKDLAKRAISAGKEGIIDVNERIISKLKKVKEER
ncbi:MAG: PTS sugar transporter subunit IIA [Candidatus Njordarchaeia archaeon]